MLPSAANALLGVDSPRQYLILGQDPFELRATGGFMGGLGLIKVANGAITSLDYRGVLDFEPPNQIRLEPPPPLVKYMGLGGWYLRDANWSPDFPTSARQVEAFFKMDQGVQADGVIALDLYAVQDLLAAIGPVAIPAYKETVTADTLLPQLWDQINASGSVAAGARAGQHGLLECPGRRTYAAPAAAQRSRRPQTGLRPPPGRPGASPAGLRRRPQRGSAGDARPG